MKKHKQELLALFILTGLLFLLSACTPAQVDTDKPNENLNVVATTTFVGETVDIIAGDSINLVVLLDPGINPHAYEPTPKDVATIADADLVFANGVGLEVFLENILENAGENAEIVYVSDGIELRSFNHKLTHENETETGAGFDPHVWFDPNNIAVWTRNIETTLNRLDPENTETYTAQAESYRVELENLDVWVRARVAQIPSENRKLVTDHTAFDYFADEYGFVQIGAVIPAPTTEAEPSGQQLAELEDAILTYNVKAIFVGMGFDATLSQQVAEDTGVQLVPLLFGSLTASDGIADNYLDFTRYNVNAIVAALE
ncbi:MAG: metal ABC transporter substrate-binding protein [Chloroflexota bacterium]|nr:metal ABC transporter substrate-binding protein [Chloroflexota bacterium]